MTEITEISLIILNYNTTDYLRICLNSLKENLKDIHAHTEVIVVDNNSPNRDIERFPDEFPDFHFLFRKVNDGFGCGCNYGAKFSKGRYLAFINPDIKIKGDVFPRIMHYMETNEDAGIVSGIFTDEKDNLIYSFNDYPSLSWEFYQFIGFGYDQKIRRLLKRKEVVENKIFEVDWIPGAFFVIRKNDFKSIGGFNEKYFIYYEDVEICYKVNKFLCKKIICIPEIKIIHYSNSSIKEEKNDNLYIFNMHRGKLIFIKNYYFIKRAVLWSLGLCSVVIRIFYLPFWKKYDKPLKPEKSKQLKKVLRLYTDENYLNKSKYEYVSSK